MPTGNNAGPTLSREQRAEMYRSNIKTGNRSKVGGNTAKTSPSVQSAELNEMYSRREKRGGSNVVMMKINPVESIEKPSEGFSEKSRASKNAPAEKTAAAESGESGKTAKAKKKKDNPVIKCPDAPVVDCVWLKNRGRFDIPMFILVMILLVMGLVMMTSASYTYSLDEQADSYAYSKQQIAGAGIGFLLMLLASRVDYHFLIRPFHKRKNRKGEEINGNGFNFSKLLFIISCGLMVAVSLFGESVSDAKRWITIFGLQFQPSEILKLSAILLTAFLLQRYYDVRKTIKYGVVIHLFVLVSSIGLCLFQRHVSATVIIFVVIFAMMFIGSSNKKGLFVLIGLVALLAFLLLAVFPWGYLLDRINCFLDPMSDIGDSTYQTYQSIVTIGSGGWFGLGLGNSRQKYYFLPESQNDFVFSIICEELGFVGGITILLLFVLLIFRGFYIAANAKDKFGSFAAAGITIQIGLQALLNIGVACNAIPNTGISLPFFSFGRTALVMQLIEMGILLSISRQSDT